MIHKIHRGENLPSVQAGTPYVIIGHSDSPRRLLDVVFPQDIRNCTTCHEKRATARGAGGTQFANYFTYPARAACQSCHDDVNFDDRREPPGRRRRRTTAPAPPATRRRAAREWDASIIGAHTVPFKSTQLKGVKAEIASVTNTASGAEPHGPLHPHPERRDAHSSVRLHGPLTPTAPRAAA